MIQSVLPVFTIWFVYTSTFNLDTFYTVLKYNYLKKYYHYIFFDKEIYFFQTKKCLENPRNT